MKQLSTALVMLTILPITTSSTAASDYVERWTQVNVTSIMNYKTNKPDNFIQQLGNLFKTQAACNQQILKYLDEGFIAEKRGTELVMKTNNGLASIHCMRMGYVNED